MKEHEAKGIREKDAEALADKALRERHKNVMGLSIHSIMEEGDGGWVVDGEVEILRGIFGTERKEFKVHVGPQGKIAGIEELPP